MDNYMENNIFIESNEDIGINYKNYVPLIQQSKRFLSIIEDSIEELLKDPFIPIDLRDEISQFKEDINNTNKNPYDIIISDIPKLKIKINKSRHEMTNILQRMSNIKKDIAFGGDFIHGILMKSKVYSKDINEEKYNIGSMNIRNITRAFDWLEKVVIDLFNMIDQDLNVLTIVHELYGKNKIYESTNNVLENHDTVLTSEIFKETGTTPREIYNWMSKNISYDKTIKGWKLRDAAKLYKDKKGNCHDQSYFTTLQLHSLGYVTGQIFFVECAMAADNPDGNAHTTTWYKEDGKFYWLETAWKKFNGIHGPFDNMDDLKKEIIDSYNHDSDINSHNPKYQTLAMGNISNYRIGMNLHRYVLSWKNLKEVQVLDDKKKSVKFNESMTIEDQIKVSMNNIESIVLYNESNDTSYDMISTPEELLNWMDCIQYGWISKVDGKIYGTSEEDDENIFFREYYLQSPNQLINSKIGVCWDQAELERKWFSDHNIDCTVIYIMINDNKNCPTHTFLVYETEDGYYKWFEHSWGQYKGIHSYTSLKDLLMNVISKHQECNNDTESPIIINNICITPKFGSSCNEFMDFCANCKSIDLNDVGNEIFSEFVLLELEESFNEFKSLIDESYYYNESVSNNTIKDFKKRWKYDEKTQTIEYEKRRFKVDFNPDIDISEKYALCVVKRRGQEAVISISDRIWKFDTDSQDVLVLHEIGHIVYQLSERPFPKSIRELIERIKKAIQRLVARIKMRKYTKGVHGNGYWEIEADMYAANRSSPENMKRSLSNFYNYEILHELEKNLDNDLNNSNIKKKYDELKNINSISMSYEDYKKEMIKDLARKKYEEIMKNPNNVVVRDLNQRIKALSDNKLVNSKYFKKESYDPPFSYDQLPEHLKNDPVHKWRAETGIELIHKESVYIDIASLPDRLYFASPNKIEGSITPMTDRGLFMTPFQGIASLFIIDRHRIMKDYIRDSIAPLICIGNQYNLEYSEWKLENDILITPLTSAHINHNIPCLTNIIEGESIGYIHEIDISSIKDELQYFVSKDANREVIYKGNKSLPITNIIEHKIHYNLGYEKDEWDGSINILFDGKPIKVSTEEELNNLKNNSSIVESFDAMITNKLYFATTKELSSDTISVKHPRALILYQTIRSASLHGINKDILANKYFEDILAKNNKEIYKSKYTTMYAPIDPSSDKTKVLSHIHIYHDVPSYTEIGSGEETIYVYEVDVSEIQYKLSFIKDGWMYQGTSKLPIKKLGNSTINWDITYSNKIGTTGSIEIKDNAKGRMIECGIVDETGLTGTDMVWLEKFLEEEGLKIYSESELKSTDTTKPIKKESMPKQIDEVESDKNGIRRKKLYMKFIEWAKEYNPRNTFGSLFDKDVFHITYSFIPEEMRYFYRLANPLLCVLSGDLTFFQASELRKLNSENKEIDKLLIFAATENDMRIFNKNDKKIYKAIEENKKIILKEPLADTFDLYIQNMIKCGDILNGPVDDIKKGE